MKKEVQYKEYKSTDWSKHMYLTEEQRKKLIQEKIERARIQSQVTQRLLDKTIM